VGSGARRLVRQIHCVTDAGGLRPMMSPARESVDECGRFLRIDKGEQRRILEPAPACESVK
jgi:hypothetical protein